MRIRGGSGLGDSIYLRPIAEHLIRSGHCVTVLTHFPDVFIGSGAQVERFSKGDDRALIAHYSTLRDRQTSTQYQDMLDTAGIAAPVPLRFAWSVRNPALIERLRRQAAGRPIIIVHGGRAPFGRTDGYGMKLVPERRGFELALGELAGCLTVSVGQAQQVYPLPVDLDLNGETSVSDLLDLGRSCDGIVGQCSYVVPLAEVFNKPFLGVWSSRGLLYGQPEVIRTITPAKILSKPTSRYIVDDWPAERIAAEVGRTFMQIEAAA